MALPSVTKLSGEKVVSIYMPGPRDHLSDVSDYQLTELSKLLKEIGGCTNASCQFLSESSVATDINITSKNSTVCRGVLQFPSKSIKPSFLRKLDSSKSMQCIQHDNIRNLSLLLLYNSHTKL